MRTECTDCERVAAVFWGPLAYCRLCVIGAKHDAPAAHQCSECCEEQPATTLWNRKAPCGKCQVKARELRGNLHEQVRAVFDPSESVYVSNVSPSALFIDGYATLVELRAVVELMEAASS